jgi:cytochrome d ubiquinol oxidase subunit I
VLPPAGILGTFAVLAANAFMNTPGGITVEAGRLVDLDAGAALFTRALGYEFWHFLIALYMTAGFAVASVYAVAWLRGRRDHYQRLAFAVPFTIAAALTPLQLVIGDLSARALVDDQPAKFAAMEITWTTRDHNPEVILGWLDDQGQIHLGIAVPDLDSLLVGYSPDAVIPGLTGFAAEARPSILEANITHLAFDVMVGLGTVGAALAIWYFWVLAQRRSLPGSVWFYRLAALAGAGCYIAVETGWITTEVGRQPWIVYGLMRVADAVTDAPAAFVWTMLATLVVIYGLIAYLFIALLVRLGARWRDEDARAVGAPEEGAPYGPRPERWGHGA